MATLTNKLLWASLTASVGIYVLAAHVAQLPRTNSEIAESLTVVFGVVAAAISAATYAIRARLLVAPIQRGQVDVTTPEGQGKAFAPFIICLVLCEAIAILGLVLAFLSGVPGYSLPFGGVALALLYLHRPMAPALNPAPSSADRASDPRALS